MTAMKTMSRAMVLALVWLMFGPGLPVGGVPEGAAQTVEPATAEVRNLDRAIAAQRKVVDGQTRSADRASALNDLANLLELRRRCRGSVRALPRRDRGGREPGRPRTTNLGAARVHDRRQ